MSETQEFWLSSPRYVAEAGELEPKYIPASPSNPIKVTLSAKIMRGGKEVDHPEDAHLKRVKQDKPKDAVKPSNQPHKVKSAGAQPVSEGRAADK